MLHAPRIVIIDFLEQRFGFLISFLLALLRLELTIYLHSPLGDFLIPSGQSHRLAR